LSDFEKQLLDKRNMKNRSVVFKPLENKRAFEKISSRIKQLVFNGTLKPGDKLPSELQLADQFNVGRQTIREALRLLELSGFISIQRGGSGGASIQNTILTKVSQSLIDAIQMENITIDELTSARLEIEMIVLKQVVSQANGSDIKKLQENIQRAKYKIATGFQAFKENIDFHSLLAKSSGNQVFVIVVQSIMAVVADFLSRLEPSLEHSRLVVHDHEDILDAIVRRDIKEAMRLLENHLLTINDRLQKSSNRIFDQDAPNNN
jgi:DNA-binding FadR family transcriptional regulator